MRIAISVESSNGLESSVCSHFGSALYFALVDVENGTIPTQVSVQATLVPNLCYGNHSCGEVVAFIQSQRAEVMLSGGMGAGAIAHLDTAGSKSKSLPMYCRIRAT